MLRQCTHQRHQAFLDMIAVSAPSTAQLQQHLSALSRFWHPVARGEQVSKHQPLGVTLLGRKLVVARLNGNVVALDGFCRHFQAQLALGDITSIDGHDCLRCPYHGWSYGDDGMCRHIPQLAADKRIPPSARVTSYSTTERHGLVWVCLDNSAHSPVPQFPEYEDPAFRTVALDEPVATAASAMRVILGTLDDTHFPWVHEGILGSRDDAAPPDHEVWREGTTLRCRYDIVQPANQTSTDTSAKPDATTPGESTVELTYDNTVYMPTAMRLVKDSPAGRYVVWLACCPVDSVTTINFWAFARNYDLAPERDADYATFSQRVRDQDKPVIESQRPALVPPLSAGISLAMAPADAPLIEYLRWLEELNLTVTPDS